MTKPIAHCTESGLDLSIYSIVHDIEDEVLVGSSPESAEWFPIVYDEDFEEAGAYILYDGIPLFMDSFLRVQ